MPNRCTRSFFLQILLNKKFPLRLLTVNIREFGCRAGGPVRKAPNVPNRLIGWIGGARIVTTILTIMLIIAQQYSITVLHSMGTLQSVVHTSSHIHAYIVKQLSRYNDHSVLQKSMVEKVVRMRRRNPRGNGGIKTELPGEQACVRGENKAIEIVLSV